MSPDRQGALLELLSQTEAAHGVYETTTLKGVYDEAWPRWYAEYAVEHGIAGLLTANLTADGLAAFLERTWADYQASDPKPADPWASYTARRIDQEL